MGEHHAYVVNNVSGMLHMRVAFSLSELRCFREFADLFAICKTCWFAEYV